MIAKLTETMFKTVPNLNTLISAMETAYKAKLLQQRAPGIFDFGDLKTLQVELEDGTIRQPTASDIRAMTMGYASSDDID